VVFATTATDTVDFWFTAQAF